MYAVCCMLHTAFIMLHVALHVYRFIALLPYPVSTPKNHLVETGFVAKKQGPHPVLSGENVLAVKIPEFHPSSNRRNFPMSARGPSLYWSLEEVPESSGFSMYPVCPERSWWVQMRPNLTANQNTIFRVNDLKDLYLKDSTFKWSI